MDFTNPIKIIGCESRDMNTQIYKTIGSLNFYKYEHAHTICFKCTGVVEYPPYVGFSGTNNNLSQLSTTSISDDVCVMIDNKYCHSNRSYYNDLVKHIFLNNGTFYANDVCNLAEYIVTHPFNLTLATRMLSTIYLQYQLLIESGYSISYIDPEDILVICSQEEGEGTLFFFSNYEKIYKIDTMDGGMECDSNDIIRVIHFYEHDNFVLPPELIENTEIPFTCHKSAWLYSLACVVLCCFNPGKIEGVWNGTGSSDIRSSDIRSSDIRKHDYIMEVLSEYTGTKMYYTLMYCLSKEPCKREFILF